MALTTGALLGLYEIVAPLGAGGMGEVYRARDTRLGRSVALKVLPDAFAQDPDRIARFEREAKLLASLNHANIAALYGLEQADGQHFLIMELVEGDTLADRIERAPMVAEDAFKIAHQVAEALEAAHDKGIVHRDLKPANVMITPEGRVKVLDFGLAKALEEAAPVLNSLSPTMSAMATNAGVILGTAGYMSPEQARGHAADHRSDVFSFGCVLYEMLTGRQTFQGDTITDMIASVVAREPDWRAIPANLHPKTEELIRRCLAKNRKDRWHAIADVRVDLETIMADPFGLQLRSAREAPLRPWWKRALPPAVAAVAAAVLAVVATWAVMSSRQSPRTVVTRFPLVLPGDQRFTNLGRLLLAISPDGAKIVFGANGQLYLRNTSDLEARPIPGTAQNASMPFFSPDGLWVGYFARGDYKLKKIAISGGAAVNICDVDVNSALSGPSWSSDNYIYFGQSQGVMRVSANGGKPEAVIALKDGEQAHRPEPLPGGDFVLFTLAPFSLGGGSALWDKGQVVAQSVKSGERKVLIPVGSDGRYVPTGHLVYTLGTNVFAVPFDVSTMQTGGPVPIIEGVRRAVSGAGGGADAQFAFSNTGSMVYIPAQTAANELVLTLVDRAGVRKPLDIPAGAYSGPRVSPDGKRLAVYTDDGKDRTVWIGGLSGTEPIHKLTLEGRNTRPLWTTDGERVVFQSYRDGGAGLFWQRVDGGPAERIAMFDQVIEPQPESWSHDGKILIFTNRTGGSGPAGSAGISILSIGSTEKPQLVIKPPASNGSLSSDGRWLAYNGAGNAGSDVYVEPFPPTGEKHQITTNGGSNPLWSPVENELFFLTPAPTRQIMAVKIQTQRGFAFGSATPLPIQGLATTGPRPYDITPDGKYFLVMMPKSQAGTEKPPSDQLIVTLNWFEELKQRVPAK